LGQISSARAYTSKGIRGSKNMSEDGGRIQDTPESRHLVVMIAVGDQVGPSGRRARIFELALHDPRHRRIIGAHDAGRGGVWRRVLRRGRRVRIVIRTRTRVLIVLQFHVVVPYGTEFARCRRHGKTDPGELPVLVGILAGQKAF